VTLVDPITVHRELTRNTRSADGMADH